MWPFVVGAAALAAILFGTKKASGKTGPTVLFETTTQLGQPASTQNWLAPSGRIYRITRWNIAGGPPTANVALALGGSWAAQPSAPNSYWLGQFGAGGSNPTLTNAPDNTAKQDFDALRVMLTG